MSEPIIYVTGRTQDGVLLIGGAWTFWSQDGFPLEMFHLTCQGRGCRVDWLEAMADASRFDNLPALMGQIEGFLSTDTLMLLKDGFVRALHAGKTYEQIVEEKRAAGRTFQDEVTRAQVPA